LKSIAEIGSLGSVPIPWCVLPGISSRRPKIGNLKKAENEKLTIKFQAFFRNIPGVEHFYFCARHCLESNDTGH